MYPPNKEELIIPKKITAKLFVPKKSFAKRFLRLDNHFFSILVGLIFSGVFCSGVYIFANTQTVAPGSSTPPSGCEPGNCNVAAPLTNGFSGSFSGNGDLTTTGSFHVASDNTFQGFGVGDKAKIYYNGNNLVIDPGVSGVNILGIGDASLSSYGLQFNTGNLGTPGNPGLIKYINTDQTFYFGNDTGFNLATDKLTIMDGNNESTIYSLPTVAPTANGQTLVGNIDGTVAWGSVSGSETDWTNTGAHLFTTGTGIFGSEVTLGGASYAVDISRNGIRMNSSLLYLGLSSSDPTIYGSSGSGSVYLFNATQLSLGSANLTTTGTGSFGNANLADNTYAINATGKVAINTSTSTASLNVDDGGNAYSIEAGKVAITSMDTDGSLNVGQGGNNTYAIDATGNVKISGGVLTIPYSATEPTLTNNGDIEVAEVGGSKRIYFHTNTGTTFLAQGSIVIPKNETIDPLSGEQIKEGDYVVGLVDKTYGDNALHASYVKLSDITGLGTIGNGSVSGVNPTTLLGNVTNILGTLGITISNGVTNIATLATKNFSADTASVKYLQMTAPNGDIYCTWIDNSGNLQKAKGNCADAGTMAATNTSPLTQTTPSSAESVVNVSSQVVAQATQFVSQVQQATQQTQQVAQQANETAQQAKKIAEQVQSQILLNIFSISPISDINVAYGVAMSPTILPTTVTTTLSDNTTQDLSITWDNGTPTYNPNVAGTYVFSGTLTLANNIINNNNLEPKVNVIVAENSNPTPTPTPSPTPNAGQQAASSLLNGVWGFVKFLSTVVTAPLKGMFGK